MAEREKEPRAVTPWDPFEDFAPFSRWPFRSALPERMVKDMWGPGRDFAPAVDVSEDDERYTVTAELPGAKKEDVTVELHEGVLTIRGEKRSEREEKGEHRRHVERTFGSFSRSFSLPSNADGDKIKASFTDGVLAVEIPKSPEAKPRTVDVKG